MHAYCKSRTKLPKSKTLMYKSRTLVIDFQKLLRCGFPEVSRTGTERSTQRLFYYFCMLIPNTAQNTKGQNPHTQNLFSQVSEFTSCEKTENEAQKLATPQYSNCYSECGATPS